MPKLDLDAIPQTNRTGYPDPHNRAVAGRWYRRLAPVAGLTEMGASYVVLKPGAWSSQRHWHSGVDELVVMLSGEAVLVEDGCETVLRAGDIEHPIVREALTLHPIGPSLEIVSIADIPAGTGLGSSGAFTVGLLRAVYAYKREHVTAIALADEACRIEIDRMKQPVGKQDQHIAAFVRG